MSEYNTVNIGNLTLESGEKLENVELAYHQYGALNKNHSNAILICHGLSASSNAADWWPNIIGNNRALNPEKYCIICINTLGSVYGSTGPRSINPSTNKPYGLDFPFITVKDTAKAFVELLKTLDIKCLHTLIGASYGGYQALEITLNNQISINKLLLIATSAEESTWGRAIHSSQRLALKADATFYNNSEDAGKNGIKAARAIGMISYRGNEGLSIAQREKDNNIYRNFKIESYLNYQGEKLANRFHAHAYHVLSECMDSHNICRDKETSTENLLASIKAKCLVVGISSDILNPPSNQKFLANHIPNAEYIEIHSNFGHDGFLIEHEQMGDIIEKLIVKKVDRNL